MRRVGSMVLGCAFAIACDAKIAAVDGRHGEPSRATWLYDLHIPGRMESPMSRNVNGAALRVLATGRPGRYDVSAIISSTSCEGPDGNAAFIDVKVSDVLVVRWVVTPGEPQAFHLDLPLQRTERMDFLYTNDYATGECDRNVTVHRVDVDDAIGE